MTNEEQLKQMFGQNLTDEYLAFTAHELALVAAKSNDFTRKGGAYDNFIRSSNIMAMYPDFPWATPVGFAVAQLLKQFDAFMTMTAGNYEGAIEGRESRLMDIIVYLKIILGMLKRSI